jgi:exopolyphosphatase / guanosine-5'-triphosphate,3'-diphosphate pyrophosphatase
MTRNAIIDLGTNTFHLLIAEAKQIIHEEKFPVRMGVGGINENMITNAGIERTLSCLKTFAATCQTHGVLHMQAFGTSALRHAKNGKMVAQRITAETGIPVKIISGDEEAQLIYQGIRAAVPLGQEKNLLMDIGGGSVEFIIGNENEIFWKQSIEVGGQRLFERFHKHEPISPDELLALVDFLSHALQPLHNPLRLHNPKTLVGSSGTFETLSDMYCMRKAIENKRLPNSPFAIDVFPSLKTDIVKSNHEERIAMPGMLAWRAEMIVVTCLLIDYLLTLHTFHDMKISRFSLKEGVLFG